MRRVLRFESDLTPEIEQQMMDVGAELRDIRVRVLHLVRHQGGDSITFKITREVTGMVHDGYQVEAVIEEYDDVVLFRYQNGTGYSVVGYLGYTDE